MKLKFADGLLSCMIAVVCCVTASAAPIAKEKEKEHEGKQVDSGSFGVYQSGHRVGTETFSIYETGKGSVIQSEFKTENSPPDVQTSEMQLAANGDLQRYEWKELSPDIAQSAVVPNSDFLNQKWSGGPDQKQHEQPYLLPVSTSILDDYFFVHREVLAWKFLAASCKQEKGQVQCPIKQRTQFGTLNPRQHSSAPLAMEFLGREKITLRNGQQPELSKFELKVDSSTWQLWLDDQFKVMRMSVVGENTEVERN